MLTSPKSGVAILLGNSRVARDNGRIEVQAQLQAFVAGLQCATHYREVTGALPRLSLAIDHKGVFRRQFVAPGLSQSATRHPRLSQLDPAIVEVFAPVARAAGIEPDHIHVLHEDSARTHALHTSEKMGGDGRRKWIAVANPVLRCGVTCAMRPESDEVSEHVTCAAVTREYYLSSLREMDPGSSALEVFIEDDPWSLVSVYVRGAALAGALGDRFAIRLHLVGKQGGVVAGKLRGVGDEVAMNLQGLHAVCVDGEPRLVQSGPDRAQEPRVLTLPFSHQEHRSKYPKNQKTARVA